MADKPQRPTRPSQKTTPSGSTPVSGAPRTSRPVSGQKEVEKALALAAVMEHAVKVHKETNAPPRAVKTGGGRSIALVLLCIPMLAFAAYAWVARPEFLWGPGVKPLPAAQEEAGIRFSMFLLAQRIQAFYERTGRYPSSLSEVDDSVPNVRYVAMDSVFELRTGLKGRPIILRSDRSMDDFLGTSTLIIQGMVR